MKLIWYYFVKYYMRTGFAFYFKNVRLHGLENIPKNKAVFFVSNHQNALIDPLLLGAFTPREMYYLTRSNVFSSPIIKFILASVNMLPIYRIRDGIESLSKNEAVFNKCYDIFENKKTLLIFPEGNHNMQRRVRALSKGFTRIVFGALDKNPSQDIVIIPVGFNYSSLSEYASSVSVYYGKPIPVVDYWAIERKNEAVSKLKNEVSSQIKKITTHIDDKDNYDRIERSFQKNEFLYPEKVNKKLKDLSDLSPRDADGKKKFNPLEYLVKLNSIFPLLIWKRVYSKIREEEFISTFRLTVGITVFPLFYLIQSGVISHFFGNQVGLAYLILSFLSVFILTKTK